MARNDVKILTQIPSEFSVKSLTAASTSIYAGEPVLSVVATAAQTGIVTKAADGSGVIGTTAATNGRFIGVAKGDSSDTSAAAGVVYTWLPLPGLIYAAKAKTSSTFDTTAEIDALRWSAVFFDYTSSTFTVDAAATDASANALVIVGGDPNTSTVHFVIKPTWSVLGNTSTLS